MARPESRQPYELAPDAAEYYVDSVNIGTSLYGSTLLMGTLRENQPPLVKAIVKLSPQMAKVMSLILAKHIREYERDVGEIKLPNALYHSLGLEDYIE